MGLCTKSVSAAQKERGQARLPNLELIKSSGIINAGKAFNVRATRKSKSLEVGKVGLPPLLGGPNTFLCKPAQMNTDKTNHPALLAKLYFLRALFRLS